MCGLVGIFDSRGLSPIDSGLLRRMNDSLSHRGPDGEGQFIAPGIGLAHRRLSIIDLEGGHQPMFNEDRSVAVIFNGEIYNFQDLAEILEQRGHRFGTRCDTEVIVHGWEEWGADCVDHFCGMFAFALWDQTAETLFLARDRLGKKPLYYAGLPNGQVVFGSELKALLRHPGINRDLDPRSVEDYFAYGYVPDPRSIYRNIAKLAPGHRLLWRRQDDPKLESYWHLRMTQDGPAELNEAQAELTRCLRDAVAGRLISDVPLGAFLSGGVDSSGIVALMAEAMAEPVNTVSISFGERQFDESAYANQIAARYGTNHHVRRVSADSFDLIDRLATIYDEPFGDSSAMPTFQVCALAREHVTVALSGDGGDELFAGYRRYLMHDRQERVRAWLPPPLRRAFFGTLGSLYPKLDWAPRFVRAKTTFNELALDSVGGYFNSVSVLSDAIRHGIYSPGFRRELQGYHAIDVLRHHMDAADTDDPLLQAQYADIKTYLPGDILVKVDRASMANSLEVRAPLLDHKLVEWSARLRPSHKLNGGQGKYLLKRAFEPYVPHELLYRPKQGFSMPIASWFRGPLRAKVREGICGSALADTGYFDTTVLSKLVDQHQSGLRDHSPVLWVLLMFDSFLRHDAGLSDNSKAT